MNILYQIIIQPINIILEFLYKFFLDATNCNIVYTIILISFVISVMCLPLYLRADKISEEEQTIRKKLEPRVKSIKKNFKGDERQFLLQTYYRQNNYHPIMALRGSFSLLLQIPFFVAAYYFFSHLNFAVVDVFGVYINFSKPDQLLNIGKYNINILPVYMTLINIIAGYVYSKDKSFKANLNLYIISLVFLVLLYNQPSVLVFYWMFNNIFSLLKNILLKFVNPDSMLKYSFALTAFLIYFAYKHFLFKFSVFAIGGLILLILKYYPKLKLLKIDIKPQKLYILSVIALWILTGLFIPSNVMASSPVEFSSSIVHPLQILLYPLLNSFGIFIFWIGIIWMLANEKAKNSLSILLYAVFFYALANLFLIPTPKIPLQNTLVFNSKEVSFFIENFSTNLIYITALVVVFIAMGLLIYKNKIKSLRNLILGALCSIILLSFYNIYKICNIVSKRETTITENEKTDFEKVINFSKTKRNVLVIFLDRAVNSYFPLILAERPELNEKYSGFVYYPNTIALYVATVFGYPPLMGGYEYSPLGMSKTEDIYEKDHNKAIASLPLMFKKNNWNATVVNTPWIDSGLDFVTPDQAFTNNGIKYFPLKENYYKYFQSLYGNKLYTFMHTKKNFIFYSLAMISPSNLRTYIYNRGRYLKPTLLRPEQSLELINNYTELKLLSKFTDFKSKNNEFLVLNNYITHANSILRFPDYDLVSTVDMNQENVKNKIYPFDEYSLQAYHPFASAMIMLGNYFDILKKNGVYDNTRIIIVSDHGGIVDNPEIKDEFFNEHTINYSPLLLVKDFNQKGPIKTSNDFMCNADTPHLATKNIISNPIHPYTNKPLLNGNKSDGIYVLQADGKWQPQNYFGKINPLDDDVTFSLVKKDIHKKENWQTDIPYSKVKK